MEPLAGWLRQRWLLTRMDAAGTRRLAALQQTLDDAKRAAAAAAEARLSLQIKRLMSAIPMFARLDAAQREELLGLFKPRFASPGERLIRVGD